MKPEAYQIAELIGKYLRQNISAEEMTALRAWLDEREENRALLESFRDTDKAQGDIDFLNAIDVDAAWQTMRNRKHRQWDTRMMRYAGYAAAVILVFFISRTWWQRVPVNDDRVVPALSSHYKNDVLPGGNRAQLQLSDGRSVDLEEEIDELNERDGTVISGRDGEITYAKPGQQPNHEPIFNTLVVPKAGTYRIVLSDGTKVWVNALSELRFPVHFGDEERRVSVKGEAYFEVAHDAQRPFKVMVNDTEIEVLGTHFNVNAYSSAVTTTLVEGAVRVTAGRQQYRLSPGQQSFFNGKNITIRQANIAKATAWKNGEFLFKSDNIKDIMQQLARWYNLEVEYEGRVPLQVGYSGQISRHVNLTEVLEMLRYLSKAEFDINGRKVHVIFNN